MSSAIQYYTIIVCVLAIATAFLLAWCTVSGAGSRLWVVLLLLWHFVLVVLWAVVVGVAWSDYHGRPLVAPDRPLSLAVGVFGIFNFLLWFGTSVMGCVGVRRGGRAGKMGTVDC